MLVNRWHFFHAAALHSRRYCGYNPCFFLFHLMLTRSAHKVGMFHALHGIEEVVPRFLSNYQYTHLDDFVTRMASRPQITQYLVSDRRIPLTENDRGDKPWSPDGYRFTEPLKESVVAETFIFPPTDKDEL